jgi:hypothetical protein
VPLPGDAWSEEGGMPDRGGVESMVRVKGWASGPLVQTARRTAWYPWPVSGGHDDRQHKVQK